MKFLPKREFYRRLPRKRMGLGVIFFFNHKKEILLVKPLHKKYWSLPGGVVDIGESPLKAATREVYEELGLRVEALKFLSVAYVGGDCVRTESLQFSYYGGLLTERKIKRIIIDSSELTKFYFFQQRRALNLMNLASRKTIT